MPLIIDCANVTSGEAFWNRYVSAVGMENCAFFGRNLDALWDAIDGGGPGWPDCTHLIFANSADLEGLEIKGVSLLAQLRYISAAVTHMKIELA